jgi:hypothetical protein
LGLLRAGFGVDVPVDGAKRRVVAPRLSKGKPKGGGAPSAEATDEQPSTGNSWAWAANRLPVAIARYSDLWPFAGAKQQKSLQKFAQCIFRVVQTGRFFGRFLLKRSASDKAQGRFLNDSIAELRVFLPLIPVAHEV